MLVGCPDELQRATRGRARWRREDRVAIYEPPEETHIVRVQQVAQPHKRDEMWVASLIVRGTAQRSSTHYSAAYAVEWAEKVRPVG